MSSRSKERLDIVIKVLSKLLHMDEESIKAYTVKTETGQAIMAKNQVVLHDQATANVYEILQELPESLVPEECSIEDISSAYNSISYPESEKCESFTGRHFDAKKKKIIKKQRKAIKQSL